MARQGKVDPKRLAALKAELIKDVPRIPNDAASRAHAQSKDVLKLMIDYLNWKSRHVAMRPRTVRIEPEVQSDNRWAVDDTRITALLGKVTRGEDLTPHLSRAALTDGVSLAAQQPGASTEDHWSDKDLVLNVMGFHHFHLSEAGTGSQADHNLLLFAEVTRDTFRAIALFDHSVFNAGTPERSRLHDAHEQAVTGGQPGVYLMSSVAMSGHNIGIVRHAQQCMRIMEQLDAQLSDPAFVSDLFQKANLPLPRKPKLWWSFLDLDLVVYSKDPQQFWIMQKGWN